ncbi:branched-chain amino acid ABC transporter permease [Acidocella facilis]|uniref:branched-chain amino acid ABC transporter permease n=1 Tax=Acidocella facilis TaxID=525 RepID=UPI001F365B6C|nr:branched-chain amino acid ABC transporter permease [Acidocella facilis]
MKFNSAWAGFIAVLVAGLVVLFAVPQIVSLFGIVQMTVFVAMAMYALSQGFLWGFGGIMCFGQASFLGLGAYAYAITAINLGDTSWGMLAGVAVPAIFALLLGYFMFYGRISDAYIGVITLTVSVILFQLINSTSGAQYHIGQAELGGFNGIPSVPTLNMPGDVSNVLSPTGIWYVSMALLIIVYALLRLALASRFGRVVVAIRENETRAMLLGYDARLYKLLSFTISAAIAGLAGCIYDNWGGFISPTIFGLAMSAEVIIFVLVGGLGTLIGPILGGVGLQYVMNLAGTQHKVDPNLGLGVVLVAFVLLVPQGVVPVIRDKAMQLFTRRGAKAAQIQETSP